MKNEGCFRCIMSETMASSASSISLNTIQSEQGLIQKSVSFHTRVRVRKQIQGIDDEREKKWYTTEDFELMRQETKATLIFLQLMGKTELLHEEDNSDSYCYRGLESRSPRIAREKLRRQQKASAAVLSTQRQQLENGANEVDQTLIARAYVTFTRKSAEGAHERGLQDQDTVARFSSGNHHSTLNFTNDGSRKNSNMVNIKSGPSSIINHSDKKQLRQVSCQAA